MRLLLITLCSLGLLVAGCASHRAARQEVKTDAKELAAIETVLTARENIRQIISHLPRNAEELAGAANGDPSALIFNVQDYAQRLQTIPLKDCPADFRIAFQDYMVTWQMRAAANPNFMLLKDSKPSNSGDNVNVDAGATEATWRKIQRLHETYLAKAPKKEKDPF